MNYFGKREVELFDNATQVTIAYVPSITHTCVLMTIACGQTVMKH